MSQQLCLNCGERPASTAPGGKTVPLCGECAGKAVGSRGVRMTPKPKKPDLKLVKGPAV